jgi:hypothetical protein
VLVTEVVDIHLLAKKFKPCEVKGKFVEIIPVAIAPVSLFVTLYFTFVDIGSLYNSIEYTVVEIVPTVLFDGKLTPKSTLVAVPVASLWKTCKFVSPFSEPTPTILVNVLT